MKLILKKFSPMTHIGVIGESLLLAKSSVYTVCINCESVV